MIGHKGSVLARPGHEGGGELLVTGHRRLKPRRNKPILFSLSRPHLSSSLSSINSADLNCFRRLAGKVGMDVSASGTMGGGRCGEENSQGRVVEVEGLFDRGNVDGAAPTLRFSPVDGPAGWRGGM